MARRKKGGGKVASLRALREQSVEVATKDRSYWAAEVKHASFRAADSIIEVGRILIQAKDSLDHGEFGAMVENDLPFGPRSARMLMSIAADERLAKRNHGSALPTSWRTLYEVSRLDDDEFNAVVPRLTPETTRREVKEYAREARREPEPETDHDDDPGEEPTEATEEDETMSRVATEDGETLEQKIRKGIALGMPDAATAEELGMSFSVYSRGRYVALLADEASDLPEEEAERIRKAVRMMNESGTTASPFALVRDLVERRWGDGTARRGTHPDSKAQNRVDAFLRAYGALVQICGAAESIEIPLLTEEQRNEFTAELGRCITSVRTLKSRIQGDA